MLGEHDKRLIVFLATVGALALFAIIVFVGLALYYTRGL
jgi:hypothetical protein